MTTASDDREQRIRRLRAGNNTLDEGLSHGPVSIAHLDGAIRRKIEIADELFSLGMTHSAANILGEAMATVGDRLSYADPLAVLAAEALSAQMVSFGDHPAAADLWQGLAARQNHDRHISSGESRLASVGRQVDQLAEAGLHREVASVTADLIPEIDASLGRGSELAYSVRLARAEALLANAQAQRVTEDDRTVWLAEAMKLSRVAIVVADTPVRGLAALATVARVQVAQGELRKAAETYQELVPKLKEVHGPNSAEYRDARIGQIALTERRTTSAVTAGSAASSPLGAPRPASRVRGVPDEIRRTAGR